MSNKRKLSIQEMKKISHEIIDDEFKTANINDGIFPVTIIEY